MVPLTLYHLRALDLMWAHLTEKSALPPSQPIRTTPCGGEAGTAPPLQLSNAPPISMRPASGDVIEVKDGRLQVPD
jgi:hydroxybutyrate-dimer hydrolase